MYMWCVVLLLTCGGSAHVRATACSHSDCRSSRDAVLLRRDVSVRVCVCVCVCLRTRVRYAWCVSLCRYVMSRSVMSVATVRMRGSVRLI